MLKRKTFNLKTWVKPLAITLSLAISSVAIANPDQRPDSHQHNPIRQILSQLDLSTEQRQDVKQLLRQSRADTNLIAADLQSVKSDLHRLIHTTDWNQAAVETALLQNQQTLASLGHQKASTMHQIWLLLSDQQKAQFSQLVDSKDSRMGDRGDKKSRHKNLEPGQIGAPKLFESLDLSEDQRAAIKSIRQKNLSSESNQALVNFREAERALIASGNFNDDSYQALQAEYQAAHLQHALAMAKTRHEIWNVLTPEQQAKAPEKMSRRKEHS